MNKKLFPWIFLATSVALSAPQAQALAHKNLIYDIVNRSSASFDSAEIIVIDVQQELVEEWNQIIPTLTENTIHIEDMIVVAQKMARIFPQFSPEHKKQAEFIYTDFMKYVAEHGENYMNNVIAYLEWGKKRLSKTFIAHSPIFKNIENLKPFLPQKIYSEKQKKIYDIYRLLPNE